MSLELTLLPLRGLKEMGERSVFCYERLRLDQDYRIFGQLTDMSPHCEDGNNDIPAKPTIKAYPIPPQVWVETYGEDGVERTREDPYGVN